MCDNVRYIRMVVSMILLRNYTSRFQMGVTDMTKQGLTIISQWKPFILVPFSAVLIIDDLRFMALQHFWPNPKIMQSLIHIINNNVCPLSEWFPSESKVWLNNLQWKFVKHVSYLSCKRRKRVQFLFSIEFKSRHEEVLKNIKVSHKSQC